MRAWVKTFRGTGTRFLSLAAGYLLGGWLVLLALSAKSQPFGGIISLTTIDFKGNAVTCDSFNSADPRYSVWQTSQLFHGMNYGIWTNYPALGFNYNGATSNSPSRTANITVATDGSIINVGNANIAGYVDTAPGGSVSINANGLVGDLGWVFTPTGMSPGTSSGIESGHIKNDMNVTFQSKSLPSPTANGWQSGWLPVTATPKNGATIVVKIGGTWTNISGAWTNRGGTLYTNNANSGWIIGGTIYNLVITNRPANNTNFVYYEFASQLTSSIFVDGQNQVLYLPNGISYSSGDVLTLNTNSVLKIYTGSDISTSGNSIINNFTKYAPAFSIYDIAGTSSSILLSGVGFGVGMLYTPSSSVSFNGGGNNTYDIVGAVICHDLTVNGHYNFHFDEALGVTLPVWIVHQPTNQTVHADSNAMFSVDAGGSSPGYQWFFNQSNLIDGAVGSSLTLTNVQMTDAGSYSVLVSGVNNSVTSAPASLVVWTDATPTLSAAFVPTNGQFQFNISGVTGLNYGVQVSTDLVSWIPVATNVSPFIFSDTNTDLSPQRFYRSVYSP